VGGSGRRSDPGERTLNSWKEIAAYLDVSVRTAQLWEKERGLPVHRLGTSRRARVVAHRDELQAWLGTALDNGSRKRSTSPRRFSFLFLALVALVSVVGLWLASAGSSSPVRIVRDGSIFRAFDGEGNECWTVQHQINPGPYRKFEDVTSGELGSRAALVRDFDGDGAREAVYVVLGEASGFVECRASDGKLLWRFQPGREIVVGSRRFQPLYTPGGGLVLLHLEDRDFVGVISMQHVYYPCQVSVLDPVDGEQVGEYWHPGFLVASTFLDYTGDGTPELVAGGFNNPERGPGHPGMVVLKLPLPPPSDFNPADPFGYEASPAVLKAILFPRSELVPKETLAVAEIVRSSDDEVEAHVLGSNTSIYYHFSRRLDLIRVVFSDSYGIEHNRLFRDGFLDHPFGKEDVERMSRLYRCEGRNADGNSREVAEFFAQQSEKKRKEAQSHPAQASTH
jgi:hypothetical protein